MRMAFANCPVETHNTYLQPTPPQRHIWRYISWKRDICIYTKPGTSSTIQMFLSDILHAGMLFVFMYSASSYLKIWRPMTPPFQVCGTQSCTRSSRSFEDWNFSDACTAACMHMNVHDLQDLELVFSLTHSLKVGSELVHLMRITRDVPSRVQTTNCRKHSTVPSKSTRWTYILQ